MDVDIDCDPLFKPETIFPTWVRASVVQEDKLRPHPCGVYPQTMARDPMTGLSAIPFDDAGDFGYLKVDFLHLNVYRYFKSRQEIEDLMKVEPDWSLLQLNSVIPKLFQLSRHATLLKELKPKSILEVADCMALIRPAKAFLLPAYKVDREVTRKVLWHRDAEDGYAFKKSHAISYSYVVWLQLHLIEQGRL